MEETARLYLRCFLVVLFIVSFSSVLFCRDDLFIRIRVLDDKIHVVDEAVEDEDELVVELWSVLGKIYMQGVEVTAMYISGYSNGVPDKLLFDMTKDLFRIGQILIIYVPRFVKDSKLTWQIKVQRGLRVMGVIAIAALWVKKMYSYKQQLGAAGVVAEKIGNDENCNHEEGVIGGPDRLHRNRLH